MKLKMIVPAMMILALGVTAGGAADDPVKVREGLMKGIGGAMGTLVGISKGKKPYDSAVVKTALTTISTNIKAFPDQFPPGSQANSEASPKIWENMDDFKAKAAKLGSDADMLLAQLPADPDAVGNATGILGKNCGGCHQLYRLKK